MFCSSEPGKQHVVSVMSGYTKPHWLSVRRIMRFYKEQQTMVKHATKQPVPFGTIYYNLMSPQYTRITHGYINRIYKHEYKTLVEMIVLIIAMWFHWGEPVPEILSCAAFGICNFLLLHSSDFNDSEYYSTKNRRKYKMSGKALDHHAPHEQLPVQWLSKGLQEERNIFTKTYYYLVFRWW